MKYSKIGVVFKPNDKPPFFIGSQIRGALGYALKRVSCINPAYTCDDCFAQNNCLYYEFYEEKNTYHKYRLDFELKKDFYDFDVYLFGETSNKLPYIASAIYIMLSKNGLGKDRVKYNDFDMYVNDKNCFNNNTISMPENFIENFNINEIKKHIKLKLVTPLRIKKDNRFLKNDTIELFDILNSIYQRKMKILGKDFSPYPFQILGDIVKKDIHYIELTRHSNRQKTTMNMGGIVGELEIKNLNKDSYRLLKLGEIIGVGKQSVFGLGKIKVESANE